MSCVSWNLQSGGGGRGGWSWKIPPVQAQSRQCRDLPASLGHQGLLSHLSLSWHQLGLLPSSKGNFFYIPAHRKAGRAAGGRANLGEGGFLLGVGRVVLLSLQSNTLTDMEQWKWKIQWMSLLSVPLHLPPMWSVLSHSQQLQQPGSQHIHQTTVLNLLKEPTLSPILHLNALLVHPLPPHYSLTTFTWIVLKKSFLFLLIIPFKHLQKIIILPI